MSREFIGPADFMTATWGTGGISRADFVESRFDEEEVVGPVALAGEHELVVRPTGSLLNPAEGIISDESVEESPHDANRLMIDEGRRKPKLRFEDPIRDANTMSVRPHGLDSVRYYVIAGVLNANGAIEPNEVLRRVFRFNQLTLAITDRQLMANIGAALRDNDFDQYR